MNDSFALRENDLLLVVGFRNSSETHLALIQISVTKLFLLK